MWNTKLFGHNTEVNGTCSGISVGINVDGNDLEKERNHYGLLSKCEWNR